MKATATYLIKRQSCHHIETSQLICRANQSTSFYYDDNFGISWVNGYLNPFQANVSFLYLLKTSENHRFLNLFKVHNKGSIKNSVDIIFVDLWLSLNAL